MNVRTIIVFVALAAGLGLPFSSCSTEPETPPQQRDVSTPHATPTADVTIFSGPDPDPALARAAHEKAVRILSDATVVETFRIRGTLDAEDARRQKDPRYKTRFIGGFPIDKKGPVMDRAFAEAIAQFLLDDTNFVSPGSPPPACIFNPGVAFRLRSRGQHIDVIICFQCGQLLIESSDGQLLLPSYWFGPGRNDLSPDYS